MMVDLDASAAGNLYKANDFPPPVFKSVLKTLDIILLPTLECTHLFCETQIV